MELVVDGEAVAAAQVFRDLEIRMGKRSGDHRSNVEICRATQLAQKLNDSLTPQSMGPNRAPDAELVEPSGEGMQIRMQRAHR